MPATPHTQTSEPPPAPTPALARARARPTAGFPALLLALTVLVLTALVPQPARAQERSVRVGYQKYGTLVLLKGRGTLEAKLKALGYGVQWSEFPSGPPLMEALNAGAIDFGTAGETPPIFAQAANDGLIYVAHEPAAPRAEAILVPEASPIRSVAELRGKRLSLNKGSNVHYLVLRTLEKNGLSLSDITPVYLAPADARAAFERGSVDAWAIWDPYLAAAQAGGNARVLADGTDAVPNHQFYLAGRGFAAANGPVLDAIVAAIGEVDAWAGENPDAAARELAPIIGVPAPILSVALKRQGYGVRALDPGVIAGQQAIADTFRTLGLVPHAPDIAGAVRRPGT